MATIDQELDAQETHGIKKPENIDFDDVPPPDLTGSAEVFDKSKPQNIDFTDVPDADEETDEPDKAVTLNNLDATVLESDHGRTTGRMLDHEPGSGSSPNRHGAYNL